MIDGLGKFLPESKRNIPSPTIALKNIRGFKKNIMHHLMKNIAGMLKL